MQRTKTARTSLRVLSLAAALALAAPAATAGAPAVCHPIESGERVEVPWIGEGWNTVDPDVEPSDVLEPVTAALYGSDSPLAHMEALRRATVYLSGHGKGLGRERQRELANELVARLRESLAELERRSRDEEGLAPLVALRRFDVAYAAASLGQSGISVRPAVDVERELDAALAERLKDGAMRFGAALALWTGPREEGMLRHLDAALEGAGDDPLLEKNLVRVAGDFLDAHDLEGLRREVRRRLGRS